MPQSFAEIQSAAVAFSKRWQQAKNEEAEAQTFIIEFLRVFGVAEPLEVGEFEAKVPLKTGTTGYIDYYAPKTIAIEMKSRGKDLEQAFRQLQNYMQSLPEEDIPDLWMVSDFATIRLSRRSENRIYDFKTKDLHKRIKLFAELAGYRSEPVRDNEVEVNVKAAEKMATIHDALKSHGYEGHELEVYLVRLLFCMFAEDTGLFQQDSFLSYVEKSKLDGSDLSARLATLFDVLNMPETQRAKRSLLSDELKSFQYVNGGLFKDRLAIAEFDSKMRKTL
ncbi:MAG: hypothetical protein FWD57_06250, partial [Polyangiaceae bacterium]|nr:hypothetical protein [Polyangiaceae bacterium]